MIDPQELRAWLRLLDTPGLGRGGARRLLAAFGSPQAVLEATPAAWREQVPGLRLRAAGEPVAAADDTAGRTLRWLDESPAHHVITLGDAAYPARLLDTEDPPLLLYAIGQVALLQRDAIAVVGSRNPTPQGADNARAFSRHLSRAGWTIASGLALGVDGAAHEGALEGPGRTIAVVGTGLDQVYPQRHLGLAERIASEGLLLSEYPLGMPPLAPNFPQRNRIISGLARGVLVVEATLRSGSLITARMAAEQGRDVFAIPGSIHSPQARGCHALIRQGAKLVEGAQDILEELAPVAGRPGTTAQARLPLDMDAMAETNPPPTAGRTSGVSSAPGEAAPAPEDDVLAALGHDPASLDTLLARTGRDTASLNARLLELELEGRVRRLPGAVFQRSGMA